MDGLELTLPEGMDLLDYRACVMALLLNRSWGSTTTVGVGARPQERRLFEVKPAVEAPQVHCPYTRPKL